jgi:hypothetical protein
MAAPSRWHKPLIDKTLTYVDESGRTKKFDKVKIQADGHCLFRAIVKQPHIPKNLFPADKKLEIDKINWLRLKSVEALRAHQNDDYDNFTHGIETNSTIKPVQTIQEVIVRDSDVTFQKYCQNKSRQFDNEQIPVSPQEWGDGFIVMCMPDIIQLPIRIFTFINGELNFREKYEGMNNQHSGKEPVYLLYDQVGLHYDMLWPLEGDSLAGVNRAANAQSHIPPLLTNREQLLQMLVGKTTQEEKRILGERLYPLIHVKESNLAGKITGMLLEGLTNKELVPLIYDDAALQSKIDDALGALTAYDEKQEALAAPAPDETLAKLRKTLDEIRPLHDKYKLRHFHQHQYNNKLQEIMYEWLSITGKFLNADELRKAKNQYYLITRTSDFFTRIMDIHDIYDVRGTGEMKDILCEQTIIWAIGTTEQLFGNWVCDMIQIKVPTDINKFIAGVVEPNKGITNIVQMLMNDEGRHILSAKARAVVVSIDAQDQHQEKDGVPNSTQKSVQKRGVHTDPDYESLKYLTSIYTRILKTASLQLELSAKFRPPKLGGNIAELGIADVFSEWNMEYEYGKRVLQTCRNEFLNCARTLTSQHFKLSHFFWRHTLDGHTEQWNKRCMYANPEEWFRPKDVTNPLPAVEFWRRQIKNAESIFLQRNIDGFVKIISSRIAQSGAEGREDEFAKLGLIEFQFEEHIVTKWAEFYTDKTKGEFPRLPEQCVCTSSSDDDFRKYQEMWEKIKKAHGRIDKFPEQQRRLRKWYHTRACLAFHKAVRSASLKTPEKQELYKTQNRVRADGAHYFVVGSVMSTPIYPVEGKTNKYLVLGV